MAGRCKLIDLEAVVPDSWLNPTSKIYSFWATFFHRNEAFIVEKKSPYVALKNNGGKRVKSRQLSAPSCQVMRREDETGAGMCGQFIGMESLACVNEWIFHVRQSSDRDHPAPIFARDSQSVSDGTPHHGHGLWKKPWTGWFKKGRRLNRLHVGVQGLGWKWNCTWNQGPPPSIIEIGPGPRPCHLRRYIF